MIRLGLCPQSFVSTPHAVQAEHSRVPSTLCCSGHSAFGPKGLNGEPPSTGRQRTAWLGLAQLTRTVRETTVDHSKLP
jgi:hypothetical protein